MWSDGRPRPSQRQLGGRAGTPGSPLGVERFHVNGDVKLMSSTAQD
jgi:hypothetical protein